MKTILAIVCVVLVMILLGWLTLTRSSDRTTIDIHTQKIENDARQAIDRGEKVLKDVGRDGEEILNPPGK